VISGEREFHGDKEKINQLPFVLDLYEELFSSSGITHHTPIRGIRNNDAILKIVNDYGVSSVKLDCLFSGTYHDKTGRMVINKKEVLRYVQGFLVNRLDELTESITLKCVSIPAGPTGKASQGG
jgi:hypothetical protein